MLRAGFGGGLDLLGTISRSRAACEPRLAAPRASRVCRAASGPRSAISSRDVGVRRRSWPPSRSGGTTSFDGGRVHRAETRSLDRSAADHFHVGFDGTKRDHVRRNVQWRARCEDEPVRFRASRVSRRPEERRSAAVLARRGDRLVALVLDDRAVVRARERKRRRLMAVEAEPHAVHHQEGSSPP